MEMYALLLNIVLLCQYKQYFHLDVITTNTYTLAFFKNTNNEKQKGEKKSMNHT